jgi:hypothetical protein
MDGEIMSLDQRGIKTLTDSKRKDKGLVVCHDIQNRFQSGPGTIPLHPMRAVVRNNLVIQYGYVRISDK